MIPRTELKLWVHREHRFPTGERSLPPMPLAAGLALAASAESPLGRFALGAGDLFSVGLTAKEALQQAARNAEGDIARKATTDGAGLYTWETEHAGLVALAGPRVARLLGMQAMPVVMLPAPNVALLASRDDVAALDAMLGVAEVTYDATVDPCALRAISWDKPTAAPRAWLPPEGHPLRARFVAAAGRTRCDVLRDVHEACATTEGPLAPLHVAADGAVVAEWRPGAPVVIPEVARVVLRASDDEALEVRFDALVQAMPHVLERLDWPGGDGFFRARTHAFPSLRGRAFLARMASSHAAREVPAQDLLAAWDAGEPVLAEAEVAFEDAVRLMHPDRRTAVATRDQFGARVLDLEAADNLAFQTSLATVAAFPFRALQN